MHVTFYAVLLFYLCIYLCFYAYILYQKWRNKDVQSINEFMNWSSHSSKIANKISRTSAIMNRLKIYLPTSAMKLMYESLVLSHLQFGITCWGFEWERIFKLQKRALRIMTNSKYNAHTDPIFKSKSYGKSAHPQYQYFCFSRLLWLAHIPLSALRWTLIYVSVTRNNYGMLIICMKHVFLELSSSPVNIEFTLSLL